MAGKQDVRRIGGDSVEEAVRREVDYPGLAHRRNPADRARHHEGGPGIVRQIVVVAPWVVKHSGCHSRPCRACANPAPAAGRDERLFAWRDLIARNGGFSSAELLHSRRTVQQVTRRAGFGPKPIRKGEERDACADARCGPDRPCSVARTVDRPGISQSPDPLHRAVSGRWSVRHHQPRAHHEDVEPSRPAGRGREPRRRRRADRHCLRREVGAGRLHDRDRPLERAGDERHAARRHAVPSD